MILKKAILFDMDGVLVDSEPLITKASLQALREFGISAQYEDFKPFTGMGEDSFVGGVARKYGVMFREEMKERAYAVYVERADEDLIVYHGMLRALRTLSERGYAMAVASAADRIKVETNLRVARIPREILGAVITGSDVVHKKPAPDIYLAAARAMGRVPAECLVVEDAVAGVQSALAAGMECVAVTTSFPRDVLLREGARAVIGDIGDLPDLFQAWERE